MDPHNEVHCFSCGDKLGATPSDRFVWDCPRCAKLTQLNGAGKPIEARANLLEQLQRLAQVDHDFQEQERPFLIPIGAALHSSSRRVDPGDPSAFFGAGAIGLAGGTVGLFVLVATRSIFGLLIICMALVAFYRLERNRQQKVEGHRVLTNKWQAQRRELLMKIAQVIKETS